jgi:predicted TIM-barrel fold metal-dependent hydrolase
MDRVGIDEAWVSFLPAILWRDPMRGNSALYHAAGQYPRLRPVPAIHPGLPGWEQELEEAVARAAPAVRCDPMFYGLDASGTEVRALASACARHRVPLLMAVRLEDVRQRHPRDTSPELPPWVVRGILRAEAGVRLILTHADRDFVEQVHFGSTSQEATRVLWDLCWLWGPPEDHVEHLIRTLGPERFVFGTGMPLRLPEASVAKLDLLNLAPEQRWLIEAGNATTAGRGATAAKGRDFA